MSFFIPPATSGNYRRFTVYKRSGGEKFRLGIISAVNKVQADTKARFMYGKFLANDEAVWAEEEEMVA
jgi:hypothetical protein